MTIKVEEVVAQFLDESNLGQAEYAKAYRIAIRGLRDLSWDIVGSVKIEELVFGANHTALFPLDCAKILDFGISDGCGGIASFDKVNELVYNTDVEKYNDDILGINSSLARDYTNYRYPTDQYYYGSLGVGSYNSIGKYKVDEGSKTILISPNTKYSNFLIKYLSYQNENCEYVVNIMASEALLAYIRWKFNMTGVRNTLQVQSVNRSEYYREKRNAKLRIKNPTVQELNKSARQSVKLAVKS